MPASPAWCSCSGARSGSSCLASTTRIQRLRSRFLCSSLGQHHLAVREWDESKQMRELVSRCPRGPRSGAAVGREVLAGEGIAQISHVRDAHPLELEAVDCVLVRAFLMLQALHSREGLEHHAVRLDGTPACDLQGVQDLRIAGDHGGVRVEPIGGGAHHDHIAELVYRVQACDFRRVGVGDDGHPVAYYPETGVPVPLDLHACSLFRTREPDPTADVRRTTSSKLKTTSTLWCSRPGWSLRSRVPCRQAPPLELP